MNATIGLSQETVSYSDYIELANQIFRIDPYEKTFCGDMTYEFIRDSSDDSIDDSFILFDAVNEEITIAPQTVHLPGIYDGYYLLFYFIDYPELQLKLDINIEIFACEFGSVKFKQSRMFRTYTLNDDAFSYSVPKIVTVPANCGR